MPATLRCRGEQTCSFWTVSSGRSPDARLDLLDPDTAPAPLRRPTRLDAGEQIAGFARTLRQMDDEALLERARRGDRDAFAAIVTRHQDELYTMALRILGAPSDAADVVQETFLRAYVRLPQLRGQTARAWLFRVAINCSHDIQRRLVRKPADPLEDAEGNIIDLPDTALGPEASAL